MQRAHTILHIVVLQKVCVYDSSMGMCVGNRMFIDGQSQALLSTSAGMQCDAYYLMITHVFACVIASYMSSQQLLSL